MKNKWDRRDKKLRGKKKFKDYMNNMRSVRVLAEIVFKGIFKK